MNEKQPKTTPLSESPALLAIFRLGVPILLGVLITYASNISTAQTRQGELLAAIQAQLAGMTQQNMDYGNRLIKIESNVEQNRRTMIDQGSRITVLEARYGIK